MVIVNSNPYIEHKEMVCFLLVKTLINKLTKKGEIVKEFITLHMEQNLLSKVLQKAKEKTGSLSDLIIQFFRWVVQVIGGGLALYLNYESDKSDMDDACNTNILPLTSRRIQLFLSENADVVPSIKRAALIAFYNNTDGDNWTDNSGWKTPPLYSDGFAMPGTEGSWFGNRE
jgi:hypothetical protein